MFFLLVDFCGKGERVRTLVDFLCWVIFVQNNPGVFGLGPIFHDMR